MAGTGIAFQLRDAEVTADGVTMIKGLDVSSVSIVSDPPDDRCQFDPHAVGSFSFEMDAKVADDFLKVVMPEPPSTPAFDAVVNWDPWRNPGLFWSTMVGLLIQAGTGTRFRIRQASAADRLKGGATLA